jgi:sulfane dehydrogenase subunit SoxC
MNPNEKHLTADAVAGSGLLHRRALLGRGLAFAGAVGTGAGFSTGAAAEALTEPDWSLVPGDVCRPIRCRRHSRRVWCA